MRELDIMLEAFLLHHNDELRSGAHGQFEALLECEDDLLWAWLQNMKRPDSPELGTLVNLIRRGT